jgi:flagellar FliL protein
MAEPEAEEGAPVPAKRGKMGLFLGLAGAIVLAGGGAAGALYYSKAAAAKPAAAGKAAPKGGHEGADAEASGPAEKGAPRGVLSLEPFIVNLADADGERYVKCTMRLVLDTYEASEAVKLDELAITRARDRMLTLLSSKAYADIATPDGKEKLRGEVREQLSAALGHGKIEEVYFTEFIVQ